MSGRRLNDLGRLLAASAAASDAASRSIRLTAAAAGSVTARTVSEALCEAERQAREAKEAAAARLAAQWADQPVCADCGHRSGEHGDRAILACTGDTSMYFLGSCACKGWRAS